MKKTLTKSGLLAAVILGSSVFLLQGGIASADNSSNDAMMDQKQEMKMSGMSMPMEGMDKNHDAVMAFLGIYGGRVTAVSGTTLTIEGIGKTVQTVNASGATVMRDGKDSMVSTIAVNDMLMIKGDISGTTITASKIAAMSKPAKKMMSNMKKMMKDGMKDMKKGMRKDMKYTMKNDSSASSSTN